MTRTIEIDALRRFHVSDDPRGVIANALLIATTTDNISRIDTELAPDGEGSYIPTFGGISRAESIDDLLSSAHQNRGRAQSCECVRERQ